MAGTIISRALDSNNREIITIDTAKPWGIEADGGETVFCVFAAQIVEKL